MASKEERQKEAQALKDAQEALKQEVGNKTAKDLADTDTQLPWLTGNDS